MRFESNILIENMSGQCTGNSVNYGALLLSMSICLFCLSVCLSKAISRKRCKIEAKLVLITNRKSHMSFRLVANSMTLMTLNGVIAVTAE